MQTDPLAQLIFKKWAISGLFFFIFVFSIQLTVNVQYKCLAIAGFEPRTSGIGSDCSTNWATPLPFPLIFNTGLKIHLKQCLQRSGHSTEVPSYTWNPWFESHPYYIFLWPFDAENTTIKFRDMGCPNVKSHAPSVHSRCQGFQQLINKINRFRIDWWRLSANAHERSFEQFGDWIKIPQSERERERKRAEKMIH